MNKFVNENKKQSMWKYVFAFFLFLRCSILAILAYDYIIYASADNETKGWTFVEWVNEDVTFLPFQSTPLTHRLYQGLFFRSCSDYMYSGSAVTITNDLCDVKTEDYKTFRVTVATWVQRSDGTSLTIEDVFFTYNVLIKQNQRNLPWLDTYANTQITKEGNTIQVTFDYASTNHNLFFLFYILPQHIVEDISFNKYFFTFSQEPVVSWCARIKEDVIDSASFIFDMKECPGSLSFYQIKRFSDAVQARLSFSDPDTIIGFTSMSEASAYDHFEPVSLLTQEYIALFYNTESDRLTTTVRKHLTAALHNAIEMPDNIERDQLYMNYFPATWQNIKELIASVNPELDIDRVTLQQAKVPLLPQQLVFSWIKIREAYMLESLEDFQTISITLEDEWEKDIRWFSVSYWEKKTLLKKSWSKYSFGLSEDMLIPGLNKIVFSGKRDGEDVEIAVLDMYYLEVPENDALADKKLKILYFNDAVSRQTVNALIDVFEKYDLLDYMRFVSYEDVTSFTDKIRSKDYDMVVRPLSLYLKEDISNLFLTDDPLINPSQYTNNSLAQAIARYTQWDTESKTDIDRLYAANAPLYIFWQEKKIVYTQQDITEGVYDEYLLMRYLIENVRLTKHIRLDTTRVLSGAIFDMYVWDLLGTWVWKP